MSEESPSVETAMELAEQAAAATDCGALVVLIQEEFNDGSICGGRMQIGVHGISPTLMEQIVRSVAGVALQQLAKEEQSDIIVEMCARLKAVMAAVAAGDESRRKIMN